MKSQALFAIALAACSAASAQNVTDPHVTTWLTARSAQYARVYETTSDKSAGNAVTTWPRSGLTNSGGGVSTATYADVQRVAYSTNYVYIYTTGLASYTMGNWLNPTGNVFMFWPTNRAAIHRIPRNASIPTTKPKANGVGGVWVNGVYLWENGDAQSYTTSTGQVSFNGQGIWNRLAGVAEAFNFDPANGHQPNSGAYHTHINPIGLRYQLGDNVTYDATTKVYHESAAPTRHSPILGWALDGLPVYGPYGYSSPLDATSGVRRMTTGFQKRDGTNGSTNLATTGRTTLPVWAASVQGRSTTLASTEYGPAVNTTCPLGTFAEDYDYLGDLGRTQGVDFDLNRQNVRYGVTPEYPSGTYAYFVAIDASGTTTFPDVINQEFFGSAAGGQGTVTSINEAVTDYQLAGPATAITVTATASGAGVALGWNSAEGATYKVESSPDNATWTTLSPAVTSGGLTTRFTASASAAYFRVTLTAIATYDSGGTYGTPVGKSGSVQYAAAAASPSVTTQPASATVTAGAAASFSVVAAGSTPFAYQWQKGGVAINGASSATYSIPSAQASDAGTYACVVSNSAGSVTSNSATLTVNAAAIAPTITTQPTSVTVTAGASAAFTVAASGTAPLAYQWYKGVTSLIGATSSSYTVASAQLAYAGNYTCVVTNSAGAATSSAAVLTVSAPGVAPAITLQPTSVTATAGSAASFTVAASGTAPFTYEWTKGGVTIGGATTDTLTLANVQAGDAATYACIVSNSAGRATSQAASLTVAVAAVAPSIVTQPVSSTVSVGGSVTFSVVANGSAPLTYQWLKEGVAISGATSSTYPLASVQTGNAGSYSCTVANGAGTTTSGSATLTVSTAAVAPTVTSQPVGANVTAGATVSFTVAASGTAPLAYQWYKGVAAINGATAATYTIAVTQTSDAGSFSCVITNTAGTATSAPAVLTVTPASTGGGSSGGDSTGGSGGPIAARLVNVSVRAQVGGAAGTPVVGFVLKGSGSGKQVIVRAVGPTLQSYGVADALSDPQLQLWTGEQLVASNDNWRAADATSFVAVGAFPLLAGSADAALVTTLPAAAYTTPVTPANGGQGIVLVECYDGSSTDTTTRLANASARATVGTGDKVLIPAFVIEGEGTVRLLIRAVGPQLFAYGVRDALADPQLTIYRGTDVVGTNNNWSDNPNATAVAAAAAASGAFPLPEGGKDAALLVNLPAGAYTVVASGVGATTGTALVEFYVVE